MESWAVRHHRQKWGHAGDKLVRVHCRLDRMKGTAHGGDDEQEEQYGRAKFGGDMRAAVSLVQRCLSDSALDAIADAVLGAKQAPVFVFPHPAFDDDDGDGSMA